MIARPMTGGATGRYRATGSSSATTPSSTSAASSVAVNVLLIEPISKTASGLTPRLQIPWVVPTTIAAPRGAARSTFIDPS